MEIRRVELQNVKSYKSAVVHFTPGVNAICGENGAGKTTLLEAIGFALFDSSPYRPIDQFVREGEKTATVTVSFISGRDEREYEVVRKCGSSNQFYVYDPELGMKLVEGKTDVMDWLAEQMAVGTADQLSTLFTDAVGVSQGQLTSAFQMTPAQRKPTFDRLLRVDEYDHAAGALLGTIRYIRDETNKAAVKAAELEGEIKALPQHEKKAAECEAAIAADEAQLEKLQVELDQVRQERSALETQRKVVEGLSASANALTERVQGLEARHKVAGQASREAAEAEAIVKNAKRGHQQHEAAVEKLETLEKQRKERDALAGRVNDLETKCAGSESKQAALVTQLEAIAHAEAQMAELEPRVTEQQGLEARLQEAQQRADRLKETQGRLSEEKAAHRDLRREQKTIRIDLAKRKKVEAQRSQAKTQTTTLAAQISQLETERGPIIAERERLQRLEPLLKDAKGATCPVCRQELSEAHRKSVLAEVRDQIRQLLSQEAALGERWNELQADYREQTAQAEALGSQLEELPRPADSKTLEKKIEKQKGSIETWEGKLQELVDAPSQIRELKAALKELGNPQEAYLKLQGAAGGRAKVERERATTQNRLDSLAKELKPLRQELKAYPELDDEISSVQRVRVDSLADHQRYLQHVKAAAKLPEAEKTLSKLSKDLTDATTEQRNVKHELAEAEAAYDKRRHQIVNERHEELIGDKREIGERLRLTKNELQTAQAEVRRLHKMQDDLTAVRSELEEFEALSALVDRLRKLLREAGPHITRMLVELVAARAARLYADIMNDTAARVNWEPDEYEVVLDTAGRRRTFTQLSGGEQMAAALAVRLALLREVSAIDVAFFDEPTVNLDEARRDNLAEQITNMRGFSQLFVISHDDAFERVTSNLIRVLKANGLSQANAV